MNWLWKIQRILNGAGEARPSLRDLNQRLYFSQR
jgi:hypothetical protein